jgi:pimeloyl-ACP methyl ester carboxylesterase
VEIHLTFTRTQNRGGESIVFLHPIGTSSWIWEAQLQALTNYDCIIPDLPGHGRNNHIPWVSLQETARLMATLIERHANGGQAHLVGVSLGGYVVMEILAQHKKVVRRAVISSMNVLPPSNRVTHPVYRFLFSTLMKTKLMANRQARRRHIADVDWESYHQSIQQCSPRAFRAASKEMAAYQLPENAAAIQTPTLVVAGGNAAPQVLESINRICATLPLASGYIVPFTGQGWMTEKPQVFSEMLKAWLKSYPVPDSLIPATTAQILEAALAEDRVEDGSQAEA